MILSPGIPWHSTIALILLTGVVLLAGGCTGERPAAALVNGTTVPVPPVPATLPAATVTPSMILCPASDNASHWIAINPVGRIERGDTVRFSGTTNIPAGEHLELHVYPGFFHPHCKCCFDDQLAADAIVRDTGGCNNTFSLWFDTTNFYPAEYLFTAENPDNATETGLILFTILENTTPLPAPSGNQPVPFPPGSLLAAYQPPDVARGDIQTITGIRNGTPYAIGYTVYPDGYDTSCRPFCTGETFYGIIHPPESGNNPDRFAIRFDTQDMKPGRYIADLDLTCIADVAPVRVGFNVTQGAAGDVR